jgi:hypothetical protein
VRGLHQDIRFWEKTSECLKAITKQVDSQTAVLDTLVTKLSRLKKDQAVSVKDLEQLIDELEGREKDAGRDRDARARSLTNIALCSFVVLGLCSIGSHSESLEYDRRVFGFYAALKSGG